MVREGGMDRGWGLGEMGYHSGINPASQIENGKRTTLTGNFQTRGEGAGAPLPPAASSLSSASCPHSMSSLLAGKHCQQLRAEQAPCGGGASLLAPGQHCQVASWWQGRSRLRHKA